MKRVRYGRQRVSGFTLLEVLVAMAVLSIAIVAVFELFSAGLRGLVSADDYVVAVVKAEAKMREILDDEKLGEKTWQETTDDGYRFDAAIKKTETERTERLPADLLEIDLTITWSRGTKEKSFRLKTLKLVNKQV